jgi:cobalt/nickel transport system permease protein
VSGGCAGWLSRRDPRMRIMTAVLFAPVVVSLSRLSLLGLALAAAVGLALAVGLKPGLLAKRMAALEGFMLVVLVLLPFSTPGAPLLQLGPWAASQEGAWLALSIVVKANAVVLVLLALVGTLEPVVLGHALARLRVPEKLVHLFLFTVRYIGVLHDEYQCLRRAMRARAFVARSNFHTWRSLGQLLGMLLVRSLERSQRVVAAMKCRGFDGRFHLLSVQRWQRMDTLFLLVAVLALSSLIFLERLL